MKNKLLYAGIFFIISLFLVSVFYYQYKKNKQTQKEYHIIDDKGNLRYDLKYGNNNQLVTNTYYENNTIKSQSINDTQGKIIEERFYSIKGNLITNSKYTYRDDGKLQNKEIYDNNNILKYSTRYFYTDEGSVSKTIYENKEENIITENNIDNKSVTQIIYKDNVIVHTYKDDLNNIKFYRYSDNGVLSYSYEFVKDSNTTKETIYNENGGVQTEKIFSNAGLLLEEKQYSKGVILYTNKYTYNQNGQQKEKFEYNDKNSIQKRFIYGYDKQGNRIRIDIYDAEGNKIDYY
ncbi:MAG: hypothetical protein A2015_13260 [Spirochaetes bacterium GWF1_31_7]|nr:MAG: hypothetical protein A2Y30_08825 [Spirochaetes bacterium GWE1_32_154]OHD47119.1 MAG: hypothetical protein A2Y29_05945 [Spirochaetes bacterium GWE2_31_10]OHD50685.1 MAG: hypothetical protein A2015_13260 [Spirochaetes bacterium GWF1_31_7]OHD79813.1 MAG: hypothetical protein A2355_04655 [Spirochaetes bacterium RIFOXYB1_FULL_32_8]HBD96380.1 hypothetical protein [Spirochaetia bacterium]